MQRHYFTSNRKYFTETKLSTSVTIATTVVCICYWPPVREVCQNYEVVIFQTRKFTTLDLVSVAYFFIAYSLNPPHPLFLPSDICPGGASHCCPPRPIHQQVSARYHPPTRAPPVSVPAYL